MKSRKGFSSLSVQLSATVSVSLVLLLLGMVATLAFAAHNVGNDIKEQMGFTVVLTEDAGTADVNHYKQMFSQAPYVASFRYCSPEEAQETWRREMGEDLTQLLDANPFLPEFEINVKAAYATGDSLDAIMLPLQSQSKVQEVNGHNEVVDSVNRHLHTLMMVFGIAALALLPICIALINSTVCLTIYSRRFIIHTMKLVGASRGFIRRPFLVSNLLQGLIAAVIAAALLGALYLALWNVDGTLRGVFNEMTYAWVCACLAVTGPLICLIAAMWSTQRYLIRSYDELF